MVDNLHEYDEYLEVYAAYNWRDGIQVLLDAGEMPDPVSAALLARADETLIAKRDLLVQRFPDIFRPERKAKIPKPLWWWHLDEGPQVRDEALAASRQH